MMVWPRPEQTSAGSLGGSFRPSAYVRHTHSQTFKSVHLCFQPVLLTQVEVVQKLKRAKWHLFDADGVNAILGFGRLASLGVNGCGNDKNMGIRIG